MSTGQYQYRSITTDPPQQVRLMQPFESHNVRLALKAYLTTSLTLEDRDLAIEGVLGELREGLGALAPSLTQLCLTRTGLTMDAFCSLMPSIGLLTNLQALHLQHCEINPEGAKSLCMTVLSSCPLLTDLDISHNPLHDDGARALVNYLTSSSSHIQRLSLRATMVYDVCGLCQLLLRVPSLYQVDLTANAFDHTAADVKVLLVSLDRQLRRQWPNKGKTVPHIPITQPDAKGIKPRRSTNGATSPTRKSPDRTEAESLKQWKSNRARYDAAIRPASPKRSKSATSTGSNLRTLALEKPTHVLGKSQQYLHLQKSPWGLDHIQRTLSKRPNSPRRSRDIVEEKGVLPLDVAAGVVSYVVEDRRDVGFLARHKEERQRSSWAFNSRTPRVLEKSWRPRATSPGPAGYTVTRAFTPPPTNIHHTFGKTQRIKDFYTADTTVPGPGSYNIY